MPLSIPSRPWSHIAIDLVTYVPMSQGNTVIIVIIDRVPMPCATAWSPCSLSDGWASLHTGFLLLWYPARHSKWLRSPVQFTCLGWLYGEAGGLCKPYFRLPSKANDQVERANQEVWHFLQSFGSKNQNLLHHSATQPSPFQSVLGYQPRLFPLKACPTDSPALDNWFRRSEQIWESTPADEARDRLWLSTKDSKNASGCKKLHAYMP